MSIEHEEEMRNRQVEADYWRIRAERLEGALREVRDAVGNVEYRLPNETCCCRGGWPDDNDHDSRCPFEALGRAMAIFTKLYEQTKAEMATPPQGREPTK